MNDEKRENNITNKEGSSRRRHGLSLGVFKLICPILRTQGEKRGCSMPTNLLTDLKDFVYFSRDQMLPRQSYLGMRDAIGQTSLETFERCQALWRHVLLTGTTGRKVDGGLGVQYRHVIACIFFFFCVFVLAIFFLKLSFVLHRNLLLFLMQRLEQSKSHEYHLHNILTEQLHVHKCPPTKKLPARGEGLPGNRTCGQRAIAAASSPAGRFESRK